MKENLSIVLIAHNEEAVIGEMIDALLANYDKELLEIVAVDDSSTDNTSAVVGSRAKNSGKVKLVRKGAPSGVGYAIRTGFRNVSPRAEYVLSMDSDFLENVKDVRAMINELEKKSLDGVIGSRFTEGGRLVGYPGDKKLMNRGWHAIVRIIFGIKQKDLTNNFKLYKADIVRKMPWKSGGFSMNAETGILPIIFGYEVGEVPVAWINRSPQMGKSKFKLFQVGWGYVQVMFYALWLALFKKNDYCKK
ncbi:MAG: glycosyltransferase [Candidatus Omnitrophica bacterium]|nr:glycosyltransferase [Candidatus Omnitrophota bacterium]MBU4487805.1 glycosyltransferase [Candidatus Omnitrophota bacterium]MCG2705555.1 glycosyltransferase [Candidatus Omnitrophota bacterium]